MEFGARNWGWERGRLYPIVVGLTGDCAGAGAGPVRHRDVGSGAGADSVRDASAGAEEAVSGGERAGSGRIAVQGVSGGGSVLGFHAARVPGVRAEEQGAGRDGTWDGRFGGGWVVFWWSGRCGRFDAECVGGLMRNVWVVCGRSGGAGEPGGVHIAGGGGNGEGRDRGSDRGIPCRV
jgi:hypothetical protein